MALTAERLSAELEDDYHRLWVRLDLRDGLIADAAGGFLRSPWSTCGGGAGVLRLLHGRRPEDLALMPTQERQLHCTHLLDTAQLLARFRDMRVRRSRFDIAVDFETYRKPISAAFLHNGVERLQWQLADGVIAGPAPFTGQRLNTLPGWAAQHLSREDALFAFMLRRAVHVSYGKNLDVDTIARADLVGAAPTCHTYQRSIASRAMRLVGGIRDFERADQLLRDLPDLTGDSPG